MKKFIAGMLVAGSLALAGTADAGWRWERAGRSNQYRWTNTNRPSRLSDMQEAFRQLRQSIERGNTQVALRRLERVREIANELARR
jgi:hypothetical protein